MQPDLRVVSREVVALAIDDHGYEFAVIDGGKVLRWKYRQQSQRLDILLAQLKPQAVAIIRERLSQLPYNPDYLSTYHWKTVRARAVERAQRRCMLCDGGGLLNVHHRTYARLGAELDTDVIALCEPCHRKFHGKEKSA